MTRSRAVKGRLSALRAKAELAAGEQLFQVRSAIAGLTRVQAALLLLGAGTVAYGGVQLLQLLVDRTAPVLGVGAWWLGGPLIIDLIAVPTVVVIGVAIGRFVPVAWRRYVSGASSLTVLLTIVAVPFLTGLGRRPDNPSLLDRNYWAGYLGLVAAVWGLPLLVRLARLIPRPRREAAGPGNLGSDVGARLEQEGDARRDQPE